jgi:hypothetical protein
MAMGIKPIIHNFPGATLIFPEHLVYNTIEEAMEILQGDYCSEGYRQFVADCYDMNIVYNKIEELF